jgi:hypothetical protein
VIIRKSSVRHFKAALIGCVLTVGLLVLGRSATAQSAGNNVVCNSTAGCTLSSEWSPSTAFVDAYGIDTTTTHDLCKKINEALQALPVIGGVVDARGLNSSNTYMTCAAGTTPWLQSSTSFTTTPAVVILPAGQICIQTKWIIPDRTRVFGAGIWGSGTYIYASHIGYEPAGCHPAYTSTFSDVEMFEMGYTGTPTGYPSAPCPSSEPCTDVSVEGLDLDGSGLTIGGVLNANSEGASYVNQITYHELFGTAFTNSVPSLAQYTNFQSGEGTNFTPSSSTECVALNQSAGLGGIHGMTCTGGTLSGTPPSPYAGMFLESSSNTIEDIHFEGYQDGILLAGVGNLLLNVEAATTTKVGQGKYTAYICNSSSASPCPSSGVAAIDTVVLGLSAGGTSPQPSTLQDDITGATLTYASDPFVALYALGGPVPSTSTTNFSRFNTSPRYPTWGAGSSTPTTSTTCSSPGTIYSNTSTTYTGSANTIWVCVGTTWTALK